MSKREFRRRFRKVINLLGDIADQYEQEEPNWVFLTAMELTKGALQSLRHYLEDPESGITWSQPWVEVQYPVDWDWKDFRAVYNTFTPEDLEAAEVMAEKVADTLAKHVDVYVFQELTHDMALHKRGDTYYYLLPKALLPVMEKLPPDEREKALDELYEPFMMFGAQRDDIIPILEQLTDDERQKAIDEIRTLADTEPSTDAPKEEDWPYPPELHFSGDVDGVEFAGFVFVQFHPLIVDEDERRAYYPVQTGLFFTHGDPSAWPPGDKAVFWDAIFTNLDKAVGDALEKVRAEEAAPGALEVVAREDVTAEETVGTPAVEVLPPEKTAGEVSLGVGLEARLIPAVPAGGEVGPRRTVGLPFGRTLASTQALSIVESAYKVRLPPKWSTLPRWKDLVRAEIARIEEEEGERAYEDLRLTTGDPEARGKLLKKLHRAGGGEEVKLTAEAERALRRRRGLGVGYIDVDTYGNECLVRLYEVPGGGLLEIGLSWQGLAGPLVDEWRAQFRKQAEELHRGLDQPLLFADLDEERRRIVDSMLDHIRLWEDGRRIMNVILGQVGKQSRNPIEIPAEAFRVLLWPERAMSQDWPQNWKQRVDGALSALHALTFRYRTYSMDEHKGYGGFLGEWSYVGLGRGAHGDGVYILDVQDGFIGCLRVFETGKTHLRSGREAVLFDFGRKPTPEERKALGWKTGQKPEDTFTTFDAGRAFYTSAAGLTPTQENLLHWIERNLTLRKDTAKRGHKAAKLQPRAPDAKEYRVYGPDFCPLLPPGRAYLGALGHFRRNAELGFTLYGTESRLARHPAGLMAEMGYLRPAGAARAKRAAMVREALQDLKAVIVDYLGGVVAGQHGTVWTPLEQFGDLDEKVLCKKLRIFCFIPKDYEAERRAKWEKTTDRRVTESIQEAERDAWDWTDAPIVDEPEDVDEAFRGALGTRVITERDGYRGYELHTRLNIRMKERGLRAKDLAVIFGVDPALITKWLKGPQPDVDGKVRGRAVPEDLVPLVVRWIEEGTVPTPEELAARKGRRPGVHPETGKPRRPEEAPPKQEKKSRKRSSS